MKCYKHFPLFLLALLSACSNITTPISSNTITPNLTVVPTYTFEAEDTLSGYGLLAYTSETEINEDIFTMQADGSNQTNITNNPARDIEPAWSPDGKKIAFVSLRDGNAHIFVMNPDGSNVVQLTDGSGSEYYFSWSPNGQKIAYVTYSHEPDVSTTQLTIMNPDGSEKTVLTDQLFSEYEVLGWSPDSQYMVYRIWEEEKSPGLYIVRTDNSRQLKWDDLPFIDHIHWLDHKFFIAYSRFWWERGKGQELIQKLGTDGSRTAFHISDVSIATAFDEAYVDESQDGLDWFTFSGTSTHSTSFNKQCVDSSWDALFSISPKENLVFVTASCLNKTAFFLMNDDGTVVEQIGNPDYDGLQISQANWSPDGNYVGKVIKHLVDYRWYEDIYLFDIQKTLLDPSMSPIRLTSDGATKNWGPVWQPQP